LQTLQDEQEHTRLYVERMRACGVEFGGLPVSGYFWRCVAPMEHPIDYVAGLCLTFEQANLDFAGHYGRCLAAVGDAESARLLEKIHRDEIGHVAYGLKWFRRWKNPAESDWAAFCRTLKFPLSPQRAKGWVLDRVARRAAGLDPEFIAELNVYSQSKGRTPAVFWFNPFAEGRLADGKAFNPTRRQAELAGDLENLPQFLCRQDDVVLTRRKPAVEFLSRVKAAGFALPEFVELPRGGTARECLAGRKLGALRPWAWAPDSFALLAPVFGQVTGEARAAEARFNAGLARLYGKSWSADFLRKILAGGTGGREWLCTENEVGVTVNSLGGALAVVAAIRARGHHRVVVKQSLGVAGGGALRLWEPEIAEAQRRWLAKSLAQQGELVVEPWLERVADFSVQVEMTAGGLRLCGFTGLMNDARGQFEANYAEPHYQRRIPARVAGGFTGPADIAGRLWELYEEILARLETEFRAVGFMGPAGIDAFIYRAADGGVRLKPVVELNPRYTMGRVLVELMRQTCQNSAGVFRLVNLAGLRAVGAADFAGYARRLEEQFPLVLEGEPAGRIREGALCLNDPATAQSALAVFQVSGL
jgi:hypothetical protein